MRENNKVSVRIIVTGRVQGVGFRYYVYRSMEKYPVTGYVRNLWNGDVEVLLEGYKDVIESVIPAITRGPCSSYVSGADVEWGEYTGKYNDFDIRM